MRHVFASANPKSDIRLRGAGQQPLSLWIDGFGESLRDLHSEYGVRIVAVEYLDATNNVLSKIAADPTKTWTNETFLHRDKAMRRGVHQIRARITLLANDAEPGSTDPIEVIESEPMAVTIRDVLEDWMETANFGFQHNLLRRISYSKWCQCQCNHRWYICKLLGLGLMVVLNQWTRLWRR